MPTNTHQSRYLGPDDTPYIGGQLLHNLLLFGRLCKELGMDVTPNRMVEVTRALEYIDLGSKQDVYHTLRAVIVTRQRDLALFDEAFTEFWRAPSEDWTTLDLTSLGETRRQKKTQFLPPLESTPEDDTADDTAKPAIDQQLIVLVPTFSQQEVLRRKDFAEMSAAELAQARQYIARLHWSLGMRETARFTPGKGTTFDLRRALRQQVRSGGDLLSLPTRNP